MRVLKLLSSYAYPNYFRGTAMNRATFIIFEKVVYDEDRFATLMSMRITGTAFTIAGVTCACRFFVGCSLVHSTWIFPADIMTSKIVLLIKLSVIASVSSQRYLAVNLSRYFLLSSLSTFKTWSPRATPLIATGLEMIGGNETGLWIVVFK